MGRLLSQSKVKVYNVTLDGVIIVCTSSIFLMLLTLQNTIRLFLDIVLQSAPHKPHLEIGA